MKKTMYLTFILFAGIIGFQSCEKNESLHRVNPEISEELNLKKGHVLLVEPMGPAYDTENLLDAFAQAKETGPGAVVELAAGEFYIDYMVIESFYGTFKGAGIGKTIVHTVPEGITLPVTSPYSEIKPFLIEFVGGDIEVSHMSFDIDVEEPVKPFDWYTGGSGTFLGAVLRISGKTPDKNAANSRFHHLSFKGLYVDLIDFLPYNIDNCILIGGGFGIYSFEGHHKIENCYFESVETAINSIGPANGTITIGGSPKKGNVVENSNLGILLFDSKNIDVIISHNEMNNMQSYGGMWLRQGVVPPVFSNLEPGKSNYHVNNNTIHLAGNPGPGGGYWPDGISIVDLIGRENTQQQSNFHIHKNHITLTGGYQTAINSQSTYGTKINQNVITGNSTFAIGLWGNDSGWKMIFNDFSNYEHVWTDIALGENTHDNKVICETEHTSVADLSGENTVKGPAKRGKNMMPKNFSNSEKMKQVSPPMVP